MVSDLGVPDGELPAPWHLPQHYADKLLAQGADQETAVASGWHLAIRAWEVGR
ncbi:hypothetical protein [Phytohabitans houttuyneae]|nr:hypothetical protein [Phytohabitans houttuyneae]